MKTNTTTKKLFLPVLGLVLAVIGLRMQGLWPVAGEPQLQLPTQPISKQHSIGGSIHPTYKTAAATHQSTKQVKINKPAIDLAPKQSEIAHTVSKEFTYRALATANDPLTLSSWALAKTNATAAWDTTSGNGAVIAVIDSGFALNHEDLTTQWAQNSGETGMTASGDTCWTGSPESKSSNLCDDDNNGYVDDWRGWSYIHADNNPQAGRSDPNGAAASHGTEVAGIVGAAGNNGKGIATISWNNKILPLQVLDDSGVGYTSDVTAAIYYAVDQGAAVINMSLGSDAIDPNVQNALTYAYSHNVVVVAAAGNCGTGTEYGCDVTRPGAMSYPASEPSVIAVGATTNNDTRASFSSYGEGLDVVAPGSGSLVSTMWTESNPTNAYAASLYGTSFASPFVASLAGLIKSIRPNTSVDDITALIDASARQPTGMNGRWFLTNYGHGIIDAQSAIDIAASLQANNHVSAPTLLQIGNQKADHHYRLSSSISSGCTITSQTYCTISFTNPTNGYVRYTPYSFTDSGFQASWNYVASKILPGGSWIARAKTGEKTSVAGFWLIEK